MLINSFPYRHPHVFLLLLFGSSLSSPSIVLDRIAHCLTTQILLLVKGDGGKGRDVWLGEGWMEDQCMGWMLVYLDPSRSETQRVLQVSTWFRTCYPKLMPYRMALLFSLTLCKATKACCYCSVLTDLSSFCGYINTDCMCSLFSE